jgi:hypothetical protein
VMNGSQLSGTSISESISNQIGNAGITPGPPWQYGTNSGIQSNGQFTDLLSSGSFGIVVRSGSFFQSFTASGTIAGVPYSEPLRVIGFGFNTPILDDSVSPNNVTVNGLGLGMNPATKCSN